MEKGNLGDKAYEYVLEKIITNEYSPGTKITEAEICKTLNISRTPVRQAIHRLESEGLAYRIKGFGAIVSEITYEDIIEIFEIRTLYELHAFKFYIENVSAEELIDLKNKLLTLDLNSNKQEYYDTDRAIHNIIMGHCLNSRMLSNLKTLNSQIEKFRRISAANPKRLSKSKEEHLAIIEAILKKDENMARESLEYHLTEVRNSVIEVYQHSKMYYDKNKERKIVAT